MTNFQPNPVPPQWNPAPDPAAVRAQAKANRPWYKKKRWWLSGLVVVVVIGAAAGMGVSEESGGEPADVASASSSLEADAQPAATNQAEPSTARTTTDRPTSAAKAKTTTVEKETPAQTSGQRNALRAAKNYLSISPFSRQGLIEQLSSSAGDGYSVADATYAADNVGANWNEQAAKAAKNYLEIMPFSRQGLIEQLSSSAGDGYTVQQATYGVDKAGL